MTDEAMSPLRRKQTYPFRPPPGIRPSSRERGGTSNPIYRLSTHPPRRPMLRTVALFPIADIRACCRDVRREPCFIASPIRPRERQCRHASVMFS